MKHHVSDIDFVILWVDSNDKEWQMKKAKHLPNNEKGVDISLKRYRDWDNLKYWFRAVAKYAPWVRKIHFVTDNQVPDWLDTDNPKLNCVNHSDYMPHDSLPVFNSSAIEIGLHNIEGLAEKFVYFNDDMFLTNFVQPSYYFKNNLPVDVAGFTPTIKVTDENIFAHLLSNDFEIINKHFDVKQVVKKNFWKWYNPFYGKTFIRTILNPKRKKFDGIVIPHLSTSYLKSDFEKVWTKEYERLNSVRYLKFRDKDDVNQYVFRYWRLCEGAFSPRSIKGKYFALTDDASLKKIAKAIIGRKYPEICINDCWTKDEYEEAKDILNGAFEKVLFEKCEYEK